MIQRARLLIAVVLSLCACGETDTLRSAGTPSDTVGESSASATAHVIARDSIFVADGPGEPRRLPPLADAEAQFSRYLQYGLEGSPRNPALYERVISQTEECAVYGDAFWTYWAAGYRVLSVALASAEDAIEATAEVLTAAEQVPSAHHPYGSEVIQRVARDTLRFRLVPDRHGEHWLVCGQAHDDHGFGSYGLPETVRYRVPGTSRATVLALIDSLRQTVKDVKGP